MSYQGTGDLLSDINTVITGIKNVKGAINPALEIVADPYFPEIIGRIEQLHALEVQAGGPDTRGVGLRHLVYPLGVYVEFRKNPIVMGALILGLVVGIPFSLGYLFGSRK